jgi:Family of unknown function (DUF5996)
MSSSGSVGGHEAFPAMPLEQLVDTKDTLHRWLQIVGKIRLAVGPPRNHWWHVPFHVTGRGITTRPMGGDPIFTIDFDLRRPPPADPHDGRTDRVVISARPVRGVVLRRCPQRAGRPGDRVRDRQARAVRPVRRDTVRRGHDPLHVRPGAGDPLLAGAEPGQLHPRGVRWWVLRQDQPGSPLLAHLRHRRHEVLRPGRHPTDDRRSGHLAVVGWSSNADAERPALAAAAVVHDRIAPTRATRARRSRRPAGSASRPASSARRTSPRRSWMGRPGPQGRVGLLCDASVALAWAAWHLGDWGLTRAAAEEPARLEMEAERPASAASGRLAQAALQPSTVTPAPLRRSRATSSGPSSRCAPPPCWRWSRSFVAWRPWPTAGTTTRWTNCSPVRCP